MADKSLNRATSALDSTHWDHRWGFRDTKLFIHPDQSVEMTGERYNLCGYKMPYLIPFVNRELGVTIDVSSPRPLTAKPQATPGQPQRGLPHRADRRTASRPVH